MMIVKSHAEPAQPLFVRKAFNSAVAAVLFCGVMAPLHAQEEEATAGATRLDSVQVTGSRLTRTDVEGALPVTTVGRAEIEASGLQTVGDVIQSLTFNSFGSYSSTSGNSLSGNTQIGLRGLGAERTLVLLNGRRMPPSPGSGASGVDLNSIPLAAIERIEVLQDGASAVYGSDAIGGVVNIILRKDINGSVLAVGAGRPTQKGGDENEASFVSGLTTGRSNLLFGISWADRQEIKLSDRSFTGFDRGDGVNFSTIRGANEVGNTLLGLDDYLYYAAPSCAPDRVYNFDIAGGEACVFPFADVAWNQTSLRTTSMFVNGTTEVSDSVSTFFQINYSRTEYMGRFAPVADAILIPEGSPANFLNQDAFILHRYEQLGPRDNLGSNEVLDAMFGLNIDLAGVPVEVGVRQSRYNMTDLGRNYTFRAIAQQYLGDGTYNPYDLSQNSEATLNRMRATIGRDGFYKYQEAWAHATFTPFSTAAGAVQVLLGAEARRDQFADIYDAASAAGNIGGSAGNSAEGRRSANAAYAEALLPVTQTLELNAALRWDDYSDFGSKATGKLSARFQPIDSLLLRASYGTGFRAPTLSDLYGAVSQTAPSVRDFTRCRAQTPAVADADCPAGQVITGVDRGGFMGSNPDLLAETSQQFSLGFVFNITSAIDLALDYYHIKVEDGVQSVSFQELVRREADGRALPPGTFIERGAQQGSVPGGIQRIRTGPANVATLETSGLDLSLTGRFDLGAARLLSGLHVSYVLDFEDSENKPGQSQVGDPGSPEFRAVWRNTLRVGDLGLNYNINYIDSTAAILVPDGTRQRQEGHVASFTTHDLQAVWFTPYNSEISIGVRNLFNRDPSLNFAGLDNPYYDDYLYNAQGRVPYIRFTQSF